MDLRREYLGKRDEILAAIDKVISSSRFYGGPETAALEAEFAARTGCREAVGVGSGTDALIFALRAVGVRPGDEVIVPSFTFIATVASVVHAGGIPVLVDSDPETYNVDPEAVERAIGPRTRCILVVHLFGRPAPMERLLEIARRHGLRLVEDACQAHGASSGGRPVGGLGDAGCFSFVFTKNLHGFGDGGLVTTSDESVARTLRLLRDHGRSGHYRHELYGYSSRLDEVQSAVIRVYLRDLDRENDERRRLAARYDEALGACLETPAAAPPEDRHVYHRYVVKVEDRDGFIARLAERGVDTGIHYPLACHRQPALATAPYRLGPGGCPAAETLASQVLSLPLFPQMTQAEQEQVIEAVRQSSLSGAGGRVRP